MAKKAEADGLALDGSCFPDPTGLDPHAPMHDSRTLVFAKDRLTPTYREICGRLLQFRSTKRLYAPMDSAGKPLPTLNEAIHRSVIERCQSQALVCSDDETGNCAQKPYSPRNVGPLLDKNFKIRDGLRVEEY